MKITVRGMDQLLPSVLRSEDVLEQILALLEEDEAGEVEAGLRIGPIVDDPADHPGGTVMSLVLVIPDDKMVLVDVALPLKDHGGNEVVSPDGTPWLAPGWSVASDDPAIAAVTPNDGSEAGFPPAGTGFWIRGKGLGQTAGHVAVPLPDGSALTVDLLVNVIASAPQEGAVTFGAPVDDPNPAA
jgi:hypothetical protein